MTYLKLTGDASSVQQLTGLAVTILSALSYPIHWAFGPRISELSIVISATISTAMIPKLQVSF